jgi:hypothetical protein
MLKVNIRGLVNSLPDRIHVYQPIIEAVVNSIQAIAKQGTDGNITIVLKRNPQQTIDEGIIPGVQGVEIHDNGVGFTGENMESFDTLYSAFKAEEGGRGFGRVTFLKFFQSVRVVSNYRSGADTYRRTFDFTGRSSSTFAENETHELIRDSLPGTVIYLDGLVEKYERHFHVRLETIARNLAEKLLVYFIDEKFPCPKIIVRDELGGEIVLNSFFKEHKEIQQVAESAFTLTKDGKEGNFQVKVFKIYFSRNSSSITLTAHSRAVTSESLAEYIPEFTGDFVDLDSDQNYVIKAYVLGDYLNENVETDRSAFTFPKTAADGDVNLFYPFNRKEVESAAADIIEKHFKEEVASRNERKVKEIQNYVDDEAPWYRTVIKGLDLKQFPHFHEKIALETELHKLSYQRERTAKLRAEQLAANPDVEDFEEQVREITATLTDSAQADLAHYVMHRRTVLQMLKQSLEWDDSGRFSKEEAVHSIVFPMRSDSETVPYDDHNLWILDERLSFSAYVASDIALEPRGMRPDVIVYNQPIAFRDGEEASNPITVFEFKRPQRDEYDDNENPIKQVGEYIKKVRSGILRGPKGRPIAVGKDTPAYGFVVCDLTPKIQGFCTEYSLTASPDNQGFFGYHVGYDMYVEVISFQKLLKDAELRNRIFFHKLGLK